MRLTDNQVTYIKEAFLKHFTKRDRLWLFGSRVDMQKCGGDIDFYIETHYSDLGIVVSKKTSFLVDLQKKIGEQKIDVVINVLPSRKKLPIYEEARTTGIRLI
jgi:hypothetical protein